VNSLGFTGARITSSSAAIPIIALQKPACRRCAPDLSRSTAQKLDSRVSSLKVDIKLANFSSNKQRRAQEGQNLLQKITGPSYSPSRHPTDSCLSSSFPQVRSFTRQETPRSKIMQAHFLHLDTLGYPTSPSLTCLKNPKKGGSLKTSLEIDLDDIRLSLLQQVPRSFIANRAAHLSRLQVLPISTHLRELSIPSWNTKTAQLQVGALEFGPVLSNLTNADSLICKEPFSSREKRALKSSSSLSLIAPLCVRLSMTSPTACQTFSSTAQ
jgi:hypothetical protein